MTKLSSSPSSPRRGGALEESAGVTTLLPHAEASAAVEEGSSQSLRSRQRAVLGRRKLCTWPRAVAGEGWLCGEGTGEAREEGEGGGADGERRCGVCGVEYGVTIAVVALPSVMLQRFMSVSDRWPA